MNSFSSAFHIDLLAVGIAVSAIVLLGMVSYLGNRGSITARNFCAFAFATVAWNLTNFFQYQFTTEDATLLALRLNLFAAVWHAYFFFQFAYVFPRDTITMPWYQKYIVLPAVLCVSLLTQTPLVFSGIEALAPVGQVTRAIQGPAIPIFGAIAFGLLIAGLFSLMRTMRRERDEQRKRQALLVFTGMSMTALLILLFSVVLPLSFKQESFLPYAGIFMLPLIVLIAYAVIKHQLFNLKALAVQVLTFLLGGLTFAEVLVTHDPILLIFRGALLAGIVGAGVALTRGVTREIEQRELIETQEKELEIANRQQESLLHFISHEVKGYLTKSEAAFASIIEGDFGAIPEKLIGMSKIALADTRKGVDTVMEILDASNLKRGTITYEKKKFDFKMVVLDIASNLKPAAQKKQIDITVSDDGGPYDMTGDERKMRSHVVRNLIDNAIKYTPSGSVHIDLSHRDNVIRLVVKDSGIGITPEDMERLFTEGGKGKDSTKWNVDSTGYGLFVAKSVVDAHAGKIWAESDGQGKGSRFIVELPVLN